MRCGYIELSGPHAHRDSVVPSQPVCQPAPREQRPRSAAGGRLVERSGVRTGRCAARSWAGAVRPGPAARRRAVACPRAGADRSQAVAVRPADVGVRPRCRYNGRRSCLSRVTFPEMPSRTFCRVRTGKARQYPRPRLSGHVPGRPRQGRPGPGVDRARIRTGIRSRLIARIGARLTARIGARRSPNPGRPGLAWCLDMRS